MVDNERKDGMRKNYCLYCMQEKDVDSVICPNCGKRANEAPIHHLKPGSVLNKKYMIGHALGEGGFGITYVGCDTLLNLKVAIKEYYPYGLANRNNQVMSDVTVLTEHKKDTYERGRKKFLEEARILAQCIYDSGIVSVREFFEENNTAYIVMEYLEGLTLKRYISKYGKMSASMVKRLMIPLLDSLEKVHNMGLIHRDISPDNIMLMNGNYLKLMDFGAARDISSSVQRSLSVMLKPGYAPEEQYRSRGKQGPWTDIYALCATMYKCITGETPLESNQRVYEDELQLISELGIKIDQTFEDAIMKGMSILQRDRFQNIAELRIALVGVNNEKRIFPKETELIELSTEESERKVKYEEVRKEQIARTLTKDRKKEKNVECVKRDLDVHFENFDEESDVTVLENQNVLAKDYIKRMFIDEESEKQKIKKIVFSNEKRNILANMNYNDSSVRDISEGEDGSVIGYLEYSSMEDAYILHIAADDYIYAPADSATLFEGYINVVSIEFSNVFKTQNVINMSGMFMECRNLQYLNLNEFSTENVVNMSNMFCDCESLQLLDTRKFDTQNVVSMNGMFSGCKSLQRLNMDGFDTENVTDMGWMFWQCRSLKYLNIIGFDTVNVTSMSNMFCWCENLQRLNISTFDTGNVQKMDSMFENCRTLQSLDVSRFDTRNVTDMNSMFYGCVGLQKIDVNKFNTHKVRNMRAMFFGCEQLQNLDVSKFDTKNVTNMSNMFSGCENLLILDVSNFDTENVLDMSWMFSKCKNLRILDVREIDTRNIQKFNTRNVLDMNAMFYGCENLRILDVSEFDTQNVQDMSSMFEECINLQSLDVSRFNTRNVQDMSCMFKNCSSLQGNMEVISQQLQVYLIENKDNMFEGCKRML